MKTVLEKAAPILCRCGCKFEYELEDVKEGYNYSTHHQVKYVSCPHCGELIEI